MFLKCYNDDACLGASRKAIKISTSTTQTIRALDSSVTEPLPTSDSSCSSFYKHPIYGDASEDPKNRWCNTGFCAAGYRGHMCADCEKGYARENEIFKSCVECEANYLYWVRVSFIILLSIVTFYFAIKENLRPDNYKELLAAAAQHAAIDENGENEMHSNEAKQRVQSNEINLNY